jgi:hypothetical protein
VIELYKIEFYGLQGHQSPVGFYTVDEEVALADVRQVMANWYCNQSEQLARYLYELHLGDDEVETVEDQDEDDMHAPFVGSFIVQDCRGRVVERVASEIVRHSPEMQTADPIWFERRDPDFERRETEAAERSRLERIRRIESAAYTAHDDDLPF